MLNDVKKNIYITSPIFYANSNPHIGHVYTGLLCDAWKKFNQIFGRNVVFTSGMDEHGQKVMQSAEKNGCTSQEYVDLMSNSFKSCFAIHNVEYSNWIRTTDKKHEEAVYEFWKTLEKNGYIYKNKYEGWYSISDEHYIEGDKYSMKATDKIVWREEECYYFKLTAFQDRLYDYYKHNKEVVIPNTRYNETIGLFKQGLRDFSISRPKERLSWGIEVPGDETQVIYVWIDALVSYLSSIGYPNSEYKELLPAVHFLGKDILKFHAIYWPALLMAADLPLPKKLVVHGWWLNGDQKISKSLNNAIDLQYYLETFGQDAFRFYLLSNMILGEDCSFKDELFTQNTESILSNKVGNLFSRLIGIAKSKNIEKVSYAVLDEELLSFVAKIEDFSIKLIDDMSNFDEYTNMFVELVDILNVYVDLKQVWTLSGKELNDSLYRLLYCFKIFSVFYYPLLPDAVRKILNYFEVDINFENAKHHKDFIIKENLILFPRQK